MLKNNWLSGIGFGEFYEQYLYYQAPYFEKGQYTTKELLQIAYDSDPALAKANWLSEAQGYLTSNPSATPQEAGVYALLKMYGDSINLSRQGVNSNNSNV